MSVTVQEDNIEVEISETANVIRPFLVFAPCEPHNEVRALIVLNQSLTNVPKFRTVWNNCLIHVCADGGANRLYEFFETDEERAQYVPLYIVGDLDSLRQPVREFYEAHGTRVIKQETQFATDYMKAMMLVQIYLHDVSLLKGAIDPYDELDVIYKTNVANSVAPKHLNIYVFGGIGGRFDQTVHSISQLYKTHDAHPHILQFYITKTDMIFLLPEGANAVVYAKKACFNSRDTVPICGLLPLGLGEVELTTHGLKYDVSLWPSSMLGNVSSSNGIAGINGFLVECINGPITINIELGF